MTRRLALAASTTLLVAIARPAIAQRETPEQIANQCINAMRTGDWQRMAGLTDRVALRQLRDQLAPFLTRAGADGAAMRYQVLGVAQESVTASMSDSVVFVSWMTFMATQQGSAGAMLRSAHYQFLGSVMEGRDTVHVVARASMLFQGVDTGGMDVVSLVRAGDTWRCLLNGQVVALLAVMRSFLGVVR